MGLAGYIESPDSKVDPLASQFLLVKNAYQDYHKTSTVPFSFQNWVENTFWENIAQRTGLLKSSSIYGCWTPVWGMRTSVMIDDDAPLSRCVAIGWTAIYVPDRSVVTYGCTTPALVLFESLDLRPYVSPEGFSRTLLAQTATRFPAFSRASHRNPCCHPCRIHPPIQSCVISDNTIRETPPALHEAIQEMIDRLKNVGCLAHWISNWARRIY